MKKHLTNLLFFAVAFLLSAPVFGNAFSLLLAAGLGTVQYLPMTAGVLGMNNTNNMSARDSYERARKMFYNAFRDKFMPGQPGDMACKNFVDNLKLSQSEIRLEVNITALTSNFIFGVNPNQSNTSNIQFLTETRLNLQDSLCVNEYGIYVAQTAGSTDTAFKLNTYGNTIIFPAADAAALDSTFYANGGFQIRCNNDVICPYRGLWNHYYAPQTQETAALGAGAPKDQQRGAEDGSITSEPNVVLIGSKNYQPEIVLKAAVVGTFTNVRAILILRGLLAQNSTVVS